MSELDAIRSAQQGIAGKVVRTPVQRLDGAAFGLDSVDIAFKLEMFQRTGSFKIRGVLNKLAGLAPEEKARGVIGMSSGNHAQALAYGARLEGVPATVIMPSYSVPYKIEATKSYGAQVELVDASELFDAYETAKRERGLAPIHPFDDPLIMAGAGTAGLELLEDVPEVDTVIVGIGGGGWIGGVATALKLSKPGVRVVGVEPEGACAVRRSLDAGQLVRLDKVETIADGLAPPFTGEHALDRIRRYVDDVVLVSDAEIVAAIRAILEKVKAVVEPSGAACFAALLAGKITVPAGSTVGVMLSGGNVTIDRLRELL